MDSVQVQSWDGNPRGRRIRWTIFLSFSFLAYLLFIVFTSDLSFYYVLGFFIGNAIVWAILFFPWMRGGVAGSGMMMLKNPDVKNPWLGFLEGFIFFPIGMLGFPILDFCAANQVGNNLALLIPFAIGGGIFFAILLLIVRGIISKSVSDLP